VGVNKTLEYALSEALEKGYRAGRIGDSFDEMALRERIAQEIEERRKPFLEHCEDKSSDDYDFYLGVCNGMNFATLIARGKDDK
jgi:hypothetical protein